MISVVRIVLLAKLWNSQCMPTHGAHVETSVPLYQVVHTARGVHQMDGSVVWFITSRTCDHHTRIVRLCILSRTQSFIRRCNKSRFTLDFGNSILCCRAVYSRPARRAQAHRFQTAHIFPTILKTYDHAKVSCTTKHDPPSCATKLHKCRHLLPYSRLPSSPVNHAPPALGRRGGAINHCTSSEYPGGNPKT